MKKGKTILSLLLSLLLLCGLFPSAAFAETVSSAPRAGGTGQILLSDGEGAPGDSVRIELILSSNPGIAALKVNLSYDHELLELVGEAEAAPDTGLGCTPGEDGQILLDCYPESNYTGTAAVYTFRIKEGAAPGDTEILAQVDSAINYAEEEVSFTSLPGTITVCAPPEEGSVSVQVVSALGNLHGEEVVPVSGSGSYAPGQILQLSAPEAEGCEFRGWYLNGSLLSQEPSCSYAIPEDSPGLLRFVALYKSRSYSVRFDCNGHGTAPAAQNVTHGGTAARPGNPAANGFSFNGWFTDIPCTAPYDFTRPVTGDLVLYAGWSVSGSPDEVGRILLADTEGKPGDTVRVALSVERNPGVMGLSMALDYDENVLQLLSTELIAGSNWTWGASLVFDTYPDSSFTGEVAVFSFRIREDAPLGDSWIRAADFLAGNFNNQEVPFDLVPARVNVRLHANDGEVEIQAVSALNSPDGAECAAVSGAGSYSVGETAVLTAEDVEGLLFLGWYLNGQLYSEEPVCSYDVTEDSPEDLRFAAVYQPLGVTVRFMMLGHGEAPADLILNYGELVQRPADPAADGFSFLGWFSDAACTEPYDFSAPVTSDLTLYALWQLTASAGASGAILLTDAEAYVGETVTVELSVERNPGIMVLIMFLGYDEQQLELVEISTVDPWEAIGESIGYDTYPDSDITGSVASITFRIRDGATAGETLVWVDAEAANRNEVLIPFEVTPGTVLVKVHPNNGTVNVNTRSALNSLDGVEAGEVTGAGVYEVGQTVTLSAAEVEGLRFQAWYLNGELYAETAACSYEVTEDSPQDLFFVALYVPCTYSVSFNTLGICTAPAAQTVTHGAQAVRPADPTSESYGFIDWYTSRTYTTVYDFSTPVTQDTVLYARWYRKGDVNGDGNVNMADVTLLAKYVKARGQGVTIVLAAGNVDGSAGGRINMADVTLLAKYVKARGQGVIIY